jgi:epoxyqueuosine reductase
MQPQATGRLVKQLAHELGFDLVGLSRLAPIPRADFYRQWLDEGRSGCMAYLSSNQHSRADPRVLLPAARSAVVVALSYNQPHRQQPTGLQGSVAMYAWGRDYHQVITSKLHQLVGLLRQKLDTPFDSRTCVDTAPILEREIAAAAGLGWIGKNTLLIHPRLGSYLFLGVLLTSLELPADQSTPDRCGTCRRCLDACPTRAFYQPYAMDARRCISYLTIELRDAIPDQLRSAVGAWVFGCDVCQQVCPYNRKAPPATEPAFAAQPLTDRLDLCQLLSCDQRRYRQVVQGTAMARAKLPMVRRNAAVALGNVASTPPPELTHAAQQAEPLVAQLARWALERLKQRHSGNQPK